MKYSNVPISGKVLSIVALLGIISAAIAGVGISGMATLSQSTDRIERAGQIATEGARLNRNLVELSRSEYFLAADPASVKQLEDDIAERRETVMQRLTEATATALNIHQFDGPRAVAEGVR